ncbi:predicted protein [Nematostella vectensis]|uniref:Uncharacterized protein n=2 Tax=Nematostella vectensis TaxID=45351 RepID=A7RM02_NEMVE|nr:predicted protein [Nematostella vectensis]|eukprot:XP_001639482.1 predicted protein [Nematostella vectensis]
MDLAKRIDHMTWKSEMMEKKMQDMASSSLMMNKVITTTTDSINDLNEEMTELKIQLETGFETEQDLRTSLNQAEGRIKLGEEDHNRYMAQRESILQTNLGGVESSLEENKRLAEKYTILQQQFLNNKAALLREFERRVFREHNLKDHRELSVLQERMHEALEYYYRLRGLQNRAGIAHFELRAAENGGKLVYLQSEMMRVIEHINRFLEANNTAHKVISKEAAKVARTPPVNVTVS